MVSLCLLGEECRYDGRGCKSDQLQDLACDRQLVGICPEVESGLSIPRKRCEIIGGDGRDVLDGNARVVTDDGTDLSSFFINGAKIALKKAKQYDIRTAILKDGSPSCGSSKIYDGSFGGRRRQGLGVTASLLRSGSIRVLSDKHIKDI